MCYTPIMTGEVKIGQPVKKIFGKKKSRGLRAAENRSGEPANRFLARDVP